MPASTAAVLDRPVPLVLVRRLADHAVEPEPARRSRPLLTVLHQWPEAPDQAEVTRLLSVVVEVLAGQRPTRQLGDVMSEGDSRKLLSANRKLSTGRCLLRSAHAQRSGPDVLEVCARIEHEDRCRALAGRLLRGPDGWRFAGLVLI